MKKVALLFSLLCVWSCLAWAPLRYTLVELGDKYMLKGQYSEAIKKYQYALLDDIGTSTAENASIIQKIAYAKKLLKELKAPNSQSNEAKPASSSSSE